MALAGFSNRLRDTDLMNRAIGFGADRSLSRLPRPSMKNRLRALRVERGWTQTDLGEKIGVSRQSVHAIESGKFDPSLPIPFAIATLLDLKIEEIFENPHGR